MAPIPLTQPKSTLRELPDGTIFGNIALSFEPAGHRYVGSTPVSFLWTAFERKLKKGLPREIDVHSGGLPVFVLRETGPGTGRFQMFLI